MEAPSDARLVDGWWTWRPSAQPIDALRLTRSTYTRDYLLCWNAHCEQLGKLLRLKPPRSSVVELRACTPSRADVGRNPG